MRVLVCGDRNWTDEALVWTILDGFYSTASCGWLTLSYQPFVVIEGEAKGADTCGRTWVTNSPLHGPEVDLALWGHPQHPYDEAQGMPVGVMPFPANWNKYGRAAGPIRNQEMLVQGQPDVVLAFHDNLDLSKGTKDMVTRARKAGVPIVVIGH